MNTRTDSRNLKFGNFTPLWDKAISTEDENYSIVESPLKFDKMSGYSVKAGDKSPSVSINGSAELLVLKDKKTGDLLSFLMHIFSSSGAGVENIHYRQKDEKFTGVIFFTDEDYNFVNGWKYEKGKVTGKVTMSAKNITGYKLAPGDLGHGCDPVTLGYYERSCFTDVSGNILDCTDWQLMDSWEVNTCYSSTPGGNIDPTTEYMYSVQRFWRVRSGAEQVTPEVYVTWRVESYERLTGVKRFVQDSYFTAIDHVGDGIVCSLSSYATWTRFGNTVSVNSSPRFATSYMAGKVSKATGSDELINNESHTFDAKSEL